MADTDQTFFISDVEVTQDKIACELIVRLRYASSKVKIHTLDAGMFHWNVTKQDVVHNADVIFRLCITLLRGMTYKHKCNKPFLWIPYSHDAFDPS